MENKKNGKENSRQIILGMYKKMKKEIKITIIGDIMSDFTQIPLFFKQGYDFAFENVINEFSDSDLLICNLETPISENQNDFSKEQYNFCAPSNIVDAISKLNKNVVYLTANNHCLDRGFEGLKKTIEILEKKKCLHTGTQIDKYNNTLSIMVGDCKIGIINYTYGTNAFANNIYLNKKQIDCVNLLQPQELSSKFYKSFLYSKKFVVRCVRKLFRIANLFQLNKKVYEVESCRKKYERKYLRNLKRFVKENDVVIDCLHIGGQYNASPSKYTKRVVYKSLKAGATVVSANHEHVIHPAKCIGKKIINYSLGNFLGTNGISAEPYDKMANISMCINAYFDKNKQFSRCTYSLFAMQSDKEGRCYVTPLYKLCERGDKKWKRINDYYTELLSGYCQIPSKEYPLIGDNIK